ncbi:MAG: hypothetical protein QOD06_161, partial [Candidatus Binatota bacterium]|nr:hypothetical protein [Candidatus Binatota bacterium]
MPKHDPNDRRLRLRLLATLAAGWTAIIP